MMISPTEQRNVYIIRDNGLYFKLVGPAAHHTKPDGWRVWCSDFVQDNWPLTDLCDTKWQAIAAYRRALDITAKDRL